jgi:hypothetical protein
MNPLDKNIFDKKTFSGLLKEIYNNQKRREEQISLLIHELKPLIQDIGDATLIVPLIKEYMDISIKNDEHLIKMANIVQKAFNNVDNKDDGELLSENEKAQLFKSIEEYTTPKK